jgi:hypothetical protein
MSEPQLNDPVFYDDSDYVACVECNDWYDYAVYSSLTCANCEDKQIEQERKIETTIPSSV